MKGIHQSEKIQQISLQEIKVMEPDFQFKGLDLANPFGMDGLNMAYAAEFIYNGKPIPKGLFLDIMIENTQMLVTHLKHRQPGLMLVANLSDNIAIMKL